MTELALVYCERLAGGAEPLNVISNLGYAAVGVWLLQHAGATATRYRDAAALFGIAAFSALFHAYPTDSTQLLDVLAIALVLAMLLHRALRYSIRTTAPVAVTCVILWAGTSAVLSRFPNVLSGSLLYLPTLLALGLLHRRLPAGRRALGVSLALLVAALALRTLDRPLCDLLPAGTHTGWHLLSAGALAAFIRAIEPGEPGEPGEPAG